MINPCGLGFIIESRVERTHPEKTFHMFKFLKSKCMRNEYIYRGIKYTSKGVK